ncbi:MAG: 3-isopropylmalate dehydratase large subunit [Lautropia sp.]
MTSAVAEPQTLAQKLIARAAGVSAVKPGEIVVCKVDMAMFHDSSGPRRLKPMLERLGASLWDKSRVVLVMDHYVPERDEDSRRIVRIARDWAREQQLPHVYDSQGICHVVAPQGGHVRPGTFCVGGDSHSCTGGAFGSYMFGIGATEMLGVVVTGEIWVKVPETIRIEWAGRLPAAVTAKDMMLKVIGEMGINGGRYQAMEYAGPAVRALSMAERMTMSNMSAELGAQVGLIAPDNVTCDWLRSFGVESIEPGDWRSDEDAASECHRHDASALEPQVALPHSPANVQSIGVAKGASIDVAYIGACTGAKLEDMRAAAQVLRGRRVAAGVRLVLAPASLHDQGVARQEGTLQALQDAGAQLQASACGSCSGYGEPLDGVNVVSTTARNFRGRMGAASTQVFLGSPYTVAASALTGRLTDPREVLA